SPMTVPGEKIALFIDGANLYATAKSLGFDIDYKRLLREFHTRGYLLRAFYYTAVVEDQEYSSIRPLIDWLDYNGYTVVTKATKEFVDQTGRRKVKGNMDIELAVDAMEIAGHIDHMVLFSGDGGGGRKAGAELPALPAACRFPQSLACARAILVQCAGAVVRAGRCPAADRRSRARPAGRQSHRAAVHGRLRRRLALRDAEGVRLRPRPL